MRLLVYTRYLKAWYLKAWCTLVYTSPTLLDHRGGVGLVVLEGSPRPEPYATSDTSVH
jgi:hypothetical protein